MIGKKKIVCVIPARLASTRFPQKILALLSGKPLLQWAWEGALSVPFFDEVVIAIDSHKTAQVVESFGGRWVMTSLDCLRGTDRLIEVLKQGDVKGDIWVNWQADEPFLSARALQDLLQTCETSEAGIWTLKTKFYDREKIADPNFCKVVCDAKGHALYFSRSPIPYVREKQESEVVFRHVGLYAYSEEALRKISTMAPCPIEEAESLEQLRFLFYGLAIQVHETEEESFGIDLPEHLSLAEQYVKKETLASF
jgi:3-deoxy-manno-octulosonate cytidylyltransferase (CMP-KDO synthetase)